MKTLIDFYADWCGPCQILAPTVEELVAELSDVKLKKVNIDDDPDLAEQYGVSSIPCLVLEQDGQELDRSVGVRSKSALKKFIERS